MLAMSIPRLTPGERTLRPEQVIMDTPRPRIVGSRSCRLARSEIPRNRQDGFTLIEMLIVMLLIGVMVGIVAPALRVQKFQMDGAVLQVASTMMAQQRTAVLRQQNVVLAVDSVNRMMIVHYDADNDGTIDAGEETRVIQLEDDVTFGRGGATARPLGGDMNTFADTQGGLPAIIFRRNGSASSEAILYLTSMRAASAAGASFQEDTRAIEIERATSRIRCYSFDSGAWVQSC